MEDQMPIKLGIKINSGKTVLKNKVYERAGGTCECRMKGCGHGERCGALLRGEWEMHRLAAGGEYILNNLLGMCQICHRNTPSYGVGKDSRFGVI